MDIVEDKLGRTFAAIDAGDAAAVRELFAMVYEELKANAHELMQQERSGHTLGATALVHEAYLRLVDAGCGWQSRTHFMNSAALAMRRILVDHARRKGCAKRGAGWKRALIEDADNAVASADFDWIGLDEAWSGLPRSITGRIRWSCSGFSPVAVSARSATCSISANVRWGATGKPRNYGCAARWIAHRYKGGKGPRWPT